MGSVAVVLSEIARRRESFSSDDAEPGAHGDPGPGTSFRWADISRFVRRGRDIRAAGSGNKGGGDGDKGEFHLWKAVVLW
jgi:hypothetical protein